MLELVRILPRLKLAYLSAEEHQFPAVAVAQLVEVLLYKPECRGFDSRWCHWIFSLT